MKAKRFFIVAGMVLGLAACGSDNDSTAPVVAAPEPEPVLGMGELRVTHASPDAPKVNVYVDGAIALSDVDYKVSSGNIELTEGTISVEVRGILPDGSELSVIGPVDVEIAANVRDPA